MQQRLEQALSLHQSGQLPEALAIYEELINTQPQNPDVLHLMGIATLQTGNPAKAVELINNAISLNPKNADFYCNLGLALQELNELEAALLSLERAIAIMPDHAEAHFNRGLILQTLNRLDEAINSYEHGLALIPQHPAVLYNRGLALQNLGRLEAAISSYDQAIALNPQYAEAYGNRGLALQMLDQMENAITSYDRAIALNPNYTEAYSNRGTALQALKQLDAARSSQEKAIALDPGYAFAHSNLGTVLQQLNLLDAAIRSHQQAIALKPDCAEVYANLGTTLKALNRLDEAIRIYDHAIFLKPEYAEAHVNKALAQLLKGDFSQGWVSYEWRWLNPKTNLKQRNFPQPLWLGQESLEGKTVLLHAEQGLGDSLQFCRYARQIHAMGALVILETPPSLIELLTSLEGLSQVVAQGSPLPTFDYHCPLLSLPLAFKTNLSNIPQAHSYLQSDAGKRAQWEAKLSHDKTPRIGLAWRGREDHNNDHNRSISLADLMQHLPAGFKYISLQKELKDADRDTLQYHPNLLHFGDVLNDFSDTAALCDLMDIVISVDTSIAHLSGALGKTTWILLPFAPDWRWLLDRDDSPWYPTAKLYRQKSAGDWHGVFAKISADLLQHLGQKT